ncbi:hypothetical protein [Myxosarcina sp. GI1(2024)]
MNQIVKISITLGVLVSAPSVIAVPIETEVTKNEFSNASNQMIELSTAWGFEITNCQGNVAEIEHDRTGEIACIVPDERIDAGKFIYDSTNNKIRQVATDSTNTPQVQTNNGSTNTPQNESVDNAAVTKDPRVEQLTFNFDNSYDYGICLDAILLAYEQRELELEKIPKNECANNIFSTFGKNLSKDTTLQIIKAANFYATNVLEDNLYPSWGLRRRIAIDLGYIYELDKDNSDILKYVNSNRRR